jgi:hypothetical protein
VQLCPKTHNKNGSPQNWWSSIIYNQVGSMPWSRADPRTGHGCTRFSREKKIEAIIIHGLDPNKIAHVRGLGVRFRAEGRGEEGMGGAYPCRMLVAVEASDDRPRAARCRRHSPGGKDDKERERAWCESGWERWKEQCVGRASGHGPAGADSAQFGPARWRTVIF